MSSALAMSSRRLSFVLFSMLVIFASLLCVLSEGHKIPGTNRVYMNITNVLGQIPLVIHCESQDDDLGSHVLNFQDSLKFNFRPKFFVVGGTLFHCGLEWEKGVHRSIDVYDEDRDRFRCDQRCWWSILPDGAYFYDENTEMFELMYKW